MKPSTCHSSGQVMVRVPQPLTSRHSSIVNMGPKSVCSDASMNQQHRGRASSSVDECPKPQIIQEPRSKVGALYLHKQKSTNIPVSQALELQQDASDIGSHLVKSQSFAADDMSTFHTSLRHCSSLLPGINLLDVHFNPSLQLPRDSTTDLNR